MPKKMTEEERRAMVEQMKRGQAVGTATTAPAASGRMAREAADRAAAQQRIDADRAAIKRLSTHDMNADVPVPMTRGSEMR